MPLCRRLVIAPALRKGEAVMHPRIELDLPGHAGQGKHALQFLDHGERREFVMLGTGNIQLTLHMAQGAMRTLLRLADESRSDRLLSVSLWRVGEALGAYDAVDHLAQQVGMAVVTGVFLDQMHQHPAH
jgi:hypothetical protein